MKDWRFANRLVDILVEKYPTQQNFIISEIERLRRVEKILYDRMEFMYTNHTGTLPEKITEESLAEWWISVQSGEKYMSYLKDEYVKIFSDFLDKLISDTERRINLKQND